MLAMWSAVFPVWGNEAVKLRNVLVGGVEEVFKFTAEVRSFSSWGAWLGMVGKRP
jgi:hypothetical protein